ncbi:MAG: BACON domain-containing protein [Bacteroidales bacterium]|nr:BACON domain-containing protein [Bacteroidales bacterium]
MKQTFVRLLLFSVFILSGILSSCKIDNIDYFVPEINLAETSLAGGGNYDVPASGMQFNVDIKSNCEWTASCPADWVTLSATSGKGDISLTVTVGSTRIARNTTVTIASDEVESRYLEIKVNQIGVKELSSISAAAAGGLTTATGKTASLSASFESLGLSEGDVVTGGFTLTAAGQDPIEIPAEVNAAAGVLSCSLDNLTPGTEYNVTAWVKLNDETPLTSAASQFTTIKIASAVATVSGTVVSGKATESGTTADIKAAFTTTLPLEKGEGPVAGFTITPEGGEPFEVPAVVDTAKGTFSAALEGLTAGVQYSAVAWAQLGTTDKVSDEAVAFSTVKATRYEFTFTSDNWAKSVFPSKNAEAASRKEVITVVDNGYTFKTYGCYRAADKASLRIGATTNIGYMGWIILPVIAGKKVVAIDVPKNGASFHNACRIAIYVSADNGETFTVIPGCEELECGVIELPEQQPGLMYRVNTVIEDKKADSSSLYIAMMAID